MKAKVILLLVSVIFAGLTISYWHFRIGHVTVNFHNATSQPITHVALSYDCAMQHGTRDLDLIPSGSTARVSFPSTWVTGYSFSVRFSDGHVFNAEGRQALPGYVATETINLSDSFYDASSADFIVSLFCK
jgi:hypothetical protein